MLFVWFEWLVSEERLEGRQAAASHLECSWFSGSARCRDVTFGESGVSLETEVRRLQDGKGHDPSQHRRAGQSPERQRGGGDVTAQLRCVTISAGSIPRVGRDTPPVLNCTQVSLGLVYMDECSCGTGREVV